ncbi:MAG: MATE family efflux transporter [Spirochaetales bacterium]|nr:MATE family efflux transporter [Spirochaetales bacterium]
MGTSGSRDKSDFSQGSIIANIVRMAIPMTLAVLVNALYNIVDRIYLGHIPGAGAYALTGVGLAFPVITVITAFQNLFGNGGAPLFAMARGEGNDDLASRYMSNVAFMLIVMGISLTIIAFLVKKDVLWLIGASEATFSFANDYLDVYLLGTVFVMMAIGLNPYINAQGFARTGMMTVMIGAFINIVLDPVFIFILNMGVKGAALATIISQAVSAAWVLGFLTGQKVPVRLSFKGFKPDIRMIGKVASLGVTDFCFSVTNSAVSMICNARLQFLGGDSWVASMTVVSSIREMLFTVQHGVTNGTKPIISYNYGARRTERVRTAINCMTWIMLVYFVLTWAFLMLFPGFFAKLFTNSEQVYECCIVGIRFYFCLQFFMAMQGSGQSTFTALGLAKHALFFSLLRKAILVIPLVYILPAMFNLGVKGVFAAEPVSDVLGATACYITMRLTVKRKLSEIENSQRS